MKRNFFSLISYATIACLSAFALTACGDDDNEPDAPDTPDTPSEVSLVGQWEGYFDNDKLGTCLLTVTANADQTGNSVWRRVEDGSVVKREDFRWTATSKQVIINYIVDGTVDDTDIYDIKRLDSEILLLVYGETDLFAFIKKSAQITPTKSMMVGTWLLDYQWSESREMWRYDEVTLNSNGTGHYIENAYRLEFGGNVDEFDITKWSLSGNTLTLTYPNGEYGYKEGEPEFETESIKVVKACKNMCWCGEDDEYFIVLRK